MKHKLFRVQPSDLVRRWSGVDPLKHPLSKSEQMGFERFFFIQMRANSLSRRQGTGSAGLGLIDRLGIQKVERDDADKRKRNKWVVWLGLCRKLLDSIRPWLSFPKRSIYGWDENYLIGFNVIQKDTNKCGVEWNKYYTEI